MRKILWSKAGKVVLLLLLALGTTGCWDRLEIEQRAVLLGLAVDLYQAGDGPEQLSDEQENLEATHPKGLTPDRRRMLTLSAQIAVPGRIPLGPGEGGGGGGGGSEPSSAVWVLQSHGENLSDALQHLQQQVADKLFLGHLRVIVVSEAFARQRGVQEMVDFLRRDSEVRRTAWMVVCKQSAYDMLRTAPPLERLPTLYLISTLDHARQLGKMPNEFLGMFESKSAMKGRDPLLPYLDVLQPGNVNVAGLAYFRDGKMRGTLDPVQTAAYLTLTGVSVGGYTELIPLAPGRYVMWEAYRRRERVKVDVQGGLPRFKVDIHIDGNVAERVGENLNVNRSHTLAVIDREVARVAYRHALDVIEQTKRDHVDPVGFGEYVRAFQPSYWNRMVRTKERWEALYPKVPIEVEVHAKTHRLGMRT
ncbi:MAG: Ger(x)C family spore germination protein [Alicyclobacillus sp.]|nr:Ger(x)C family spore germination protein [Alicyclobacillus sp.]